MTKRAGKSLGIIYPEQQHFACRDCPARCCSSPWGYPVTAEGRERILLDEEAVGRLNGRARAVLRAGVLPMREKEKQLVCVFLDDDLLCSLQKKHGHAFIPMTCQAYPFSFSENERDEPVALLSRYCPSIRDDYGDPIGTILPEKFQQAGGARALTQKLGLRSGRVLGRKHFARLVEVWRQILSEEASTANALARMYQVTDAFDDCLPMKPPGDQEVDLAIAAALDVPSVPVVARGASFNTRALYAYFLGGLTYPARVLLPHRDRRVRFWERARALFHRIAWFFGRGRVDLHLVEGSVPLARISGVQTALVGEAGALIRDYLREVLLRRQGMSRQTYLVRVVVDLGLMALLASRHARAAAAAAGREAPTLAEVREGIGIAELIFSHQPEAAQGAFLQSLRLKLMSDPEDFRRLLGTEL